MKIVYRIETEKGVGMYDSGCASYMQNKYKHTTPREDRRLWEALGIYADSDFDEDIEQALQEFKFGFKDIIQLRSWVYQEAWLTSLHDNGLRMMEYTCEDWDVLEGDSQIVFKNPKQSKMNFLNYIC